MQKAVDYYLHHFGIKKSDIDFLYKFLKTQMIYRDPRRMYITPKRTINVMRYDFELKIGWRDPSRTMESLKQSFDQGDFVVENVGKEFVSQYPHTTHQLKCTVKHTGTNRRYSVLLYYND